MNWTTLCQVALTFVAGALVVAQPGINGALSKRLDHPIQASVVSFTVGAALLALTCTLLGQRQPRPSMLMAPPWWMTLGGGAIGAFFVTTALIVAPKLGAAFWLAWIVAAQMLASLALDHFGVLGFAKRAVGWQGVAGAMLVIAGVALISLRGLGARVG